ncbi:hypothetical protein [Streptomyces mirabilis]|uniref:hypothetical protein n=1 Tax=Streptomyces mirabilis TaxID=68239 RepID=UPI0036B3C299
MNSPEVGAKKVGEWQFTIAGELPFTQWEPYSRARYRRERARTVRATRGPSRRLNPDVQVAAQRDVTAEAVGGRDPRGSRQLAGVSRATRHRPTREDHRRNVHRPEEFHLPVDHGHPHSKIIFVQPCTTFT